MCTKCGVKSKLCKVAATLGGCAVCQRAGVLARQSIWPIISMPVSDSQ